MKKIFVSYRRSQSEYAAGSLGRELRRRFADEQVFRDKEDIGGGVSWKQQVLGTIGSDSALLVLIEKNWASMTDAQGRLRLDQRDDPMRLEVADGLRVGATVIPLLLENAEMPGETELPEEIRAMADLNALKLRDGDWEHDIDRICALLQKDGFKCTPVNSSPSVARVDPRDATQLRQVARATRNRRLRPLRNCLLFHNQHLRPLRNWVLFHT